MYLDLTPIIPSDILQYLCPITDCHTIHAGHYGQVVFFGCDRRPMSTTCGQVLLSIRPLINHQEAACELWQAKLGEVSIAEDELLIIEGTDETIQTHQILYR
jgi:hypothetical protein